MMLDKKKEGRKKNLSDAAPRQKELWTELIAALHDSAGPKPERKKEKKGGSQGKKKKRGRGNTTAPYGRHQRSRFSPGLFWEEETGGESGPKKRKDQQIRRASIDIRPIGKKKRKGKGGKKKKKKDEGVPRAKTYSASSVAFSFAEKKRKVPGRKGEKKGKERTDVAGPKWRALITRDAVGEKAKKKRPEKKKKGKKEKGRGGALDPHRRRDFEAPLRGGPGRNKEKKRRGGSQKKREEGGIRPPGPNPNPQDHSSQ